jgi:adenylate cyclase
MPPLVERHEPYGTHVLVGGYRLTVAERTFSFVDLAGYTAASWVHGDDVAAELAIRLHDLAEEVAGPDDVVIKSIGDAVMCRSDDPRAALEWLGRVFTASESEHHFPRLRAGCHHGPAVEHRGDHYGTTVNIAARVAALAEPCELLVTDQLVDAASSLQWVCETRGLVNLRNIAEPVRIHAVTIVGVTATPVVDPVCRMRVQPANAAASIEHRGQTWWFCSADCHTAFAADPDLHIS